MKRPATRLKELRKELNYWQGMVRIDLRCYKADCKNVKKYAELMRKIQKEISK